MDKAKMENVKTNGVGTINFELQAPGHRGFQEFTVYLHQSNVNKIMVQSDKRIGYYFKDTGDFQLSKSRASGSYGPHLAIDKLTWARLPEIERQAFNAALAWATLKDAGQVLRVLR